MQEKQTAALSENKKKAERKNQQRWRQKNIKADDRAETKTTETSIKSSCLEKKSQTPTVCSQNQTKKNELARMVKFVAVVFVLQMRI